MFHCIFTEPALPVCPAPTNFLVTFFVVFKYFNTSRVKPKISHRNGFHLFLFCCFLIVASLLRFQVSPEYQLTSMVSDLRAICGVDEIAKVAASVFKSPVYRYVASPHMLNTTHNTPYAFRGMDSLAFFGGAEAFTSKPTKRDRKFAKNIRDVVSQFASDGRVQGWETFPNKTSIQTLTMQLNGVFKQDACRFWRENGMFPEFAWIN